MNSYRVSTHLNRKSDTALAMKMGRILRTTPSRMDYKIFNICYGILRSRNVIQPTM